MKETYKNFKLKRWNEFVTLERDYITTSIISLGTYLTNFLRLVRMSSKLLFGFRNPYTYIILWKRVRGIQKSLSNTGVVYKMVMNDARIRTRVMHCQEKWLEKIIDLRVKRKCVLRYTFITLLKHRKKCKICAEEAGCGCKIL